MKRGENPLVDLLVDHRKCVMGVESYFCICGTPLDSNSHIRLAEHQADVISDWIVEQDKQGLIGGDYVV